MRLHRFYVTQPLGEDVVVEDVSLVFQWTKVFRYTEGDFVILFNGDGYDYSYSLKTITKKNSTLTYTKQTPSIIPEKKITLCLSIIKKDTFELVVQKATELGVTTIIPVLSSRSLEKNLSYERLKKISQEASEQCGRGDILTIKPVTALKDVLSTLSSSQLPLLLDMGAPSLIEARTMLLAEKKELVLFIGPEGGWSEEDHLLMKEHKVQAYSLGQTVLKAETAAIVASSLLCV